MTLVITSSPQVVGEETQIQGSAQSEILCSQWCFKKSLAMSPVLQLVISSRSQLSIWMQPERRVAGLCEIWLATHTLPHSHSCTWTCTPEQTRAQANSFYSLFLFFSRLRYNSNELPKDQRATKNTHPFNLDFHTWVYHSGLCQLSTATWL